MCRGKILVDAVSGRGEPKRFAFDNEGPLHRAFVPPHRLATRLVTNGEFARFVEDGGYARPDLWLAEGFDVVRARGWDAPLYWIRAGGGWDEFTLGGRRPLQLD